jgi:hypothetical protein
MIAPAVCKLPNRSNIEVLPRIAGYATERNLKTKEACTCPKARQRLLDHP